MKPADVITKMQGMIAMGFGEREVFVRVSPGLTLPVGLIATSPESNIIEIFPEEPA